MVVFTQRFANNKDTGEEGADAKPSILQNAFYSLQFDYTKSQTKAQDPVFEDRLFEYGYAGQFQYLPCAQLCAEYLTASKRSFDSRMGITRIFRYTCDIRTI